MLKPVHEWRKISKYAQTNGVHTVAAGKVKGKWTYALYLGNGQVNDKLLAVYQSAAEAKQAAYDYV